MMIRLVLASGVPIYRQIADQLTWLIAGGRLGPGARLPSVRDLARQLPANQNTVLKAYELLERNGLIDRRQGDGTFVASTGSPLTMAERRRRLTAVLAQAAALSAHFDIAPEEAHRVLDEQLRALTAPADRLADHSGEAGPTLVPADDPGPIPPPALWEGASHD
jgi:GntR family transcriptional regulator